MAELPSGTVTFLFTDLEGSTRLWEAHPEAMKTALARHDEILRSAVESHGGHVVKTTGDGVHAVFATAQDALQATTEAQLALGVEEWATPEPLQVRMGLHSGAPESRDGDYFGSVPNRAARLMAVAHGGQIVASSTTIELVADMEPGELTFRELGEHRLRDLARPERVVQVCHPDLPQTFPPLRSLDSLPGNLPLQTTAFVGREEQLAQVADALTDARVVTLTGVGGVGKTRLALHVAADVVPSFRDGAWLCELAPVGSGDAILGALTSALGVQPRLGQTIEDSLFEFLRAKQSLLVFDNCEHVLDSAAELVDRIAHQCAGITVLATSREGLGLPGERMIAVRSLELPPSDAPLDGVAQAEAVRLFVERAADARSAFSLTRDNASAIVQVCRRLDGIPLAIELAAARVQSMKPQEIADRLDDQFRLLRGGRRTSVERHQTLRRAIDWSHDLLTDDERVVLRRLAVFAGGATLDAAEAVAGGDGVESIDVLDHLSSLVRRSLVVADDDAPETRYRLLETIRQYAHEQLEAAGEADTVQRHHAEYYAELAEQAGPQLRATEQLDWIARLTPEIDNLRTALDWAVDHDRLDLGLRVVVPLCVDGISLGFTALDWADTLATNPLVDEHPLGPALLGQAAWHAAMRVDYDAAHAFDARLRAAERRLGLPRNPADLQAPAFIAMVTGHPEEAVEYARAWVELARARGDRYGTVQGLTMLASATNFLPGNLEASIAILEQAETEARRLANPSNLCWTLSAMGTILCTVDPARAAPILREAIDIGIAVGNQQGVGMTLSALGLIEYELGDHRAALLTNLQANEHLLNSGFSGGFVPHLSSLACEFTTFDAFEAAALCQGGADRRAGTARIVGRLGDMRAESLSIIEAALGEQRLAELLARGAAMSDAEIVDYCRTQIERILAT